MGGCGLSARSWQIKKRSSRAQSPRGNPNGKQWHWPEQRGPHKAARMKLGTDRGDRERGGARSESAGMGESAGRGAGPGLHAAALPEHGDAPRGRAPGGGGAQGRSGWRSASGGGAGGAFRVLQAARAAGSGEWLAAARGRAGWGVHGEPRGGARAREGARDCGPAARRHPPPHFPGREVGSPCAVPAIPGPGGGGGPCTLGTPALPLPGTFPACSSLTCL